MGLVSALKSFDAYRYIEEDLSKRTVSGGCVSICCYLIMSYLFLSELFFSFLTMTVESEMFVESPIDTEVEHAMLTINMNITVPRIPCALVSVDAQDIMGSHVVDVGGKLHKTRVDPESILPKLDQYGQQLPPNTPNPRDQMGEGCRVRW